MAGYPNTGNGGGSGSGASIAEDMYFATTAERDTFTSNNPDRLKQGVTCAVENLATYDYFQWDEAASQWRDANLIFQGKKGDKGDKGTDGAKGETVKISAVANEVTDRKLSTTVSLDDGTSATSEPVDLPEGGIIYDGVLTHEVEVTNGIKGDITNEGKLLLAQTMARTAWYFVDVPVSSVPYEIKTAEQMGIDYEFVGSPEPQSIQLFQEGLADGSQIKVSVNGYKSTDKPVNVFQETPTGTYNWHITTPTVFMLHNSYWRVEESSQLIHIDGSTVYGTNAAKSVVYGVAADPSSDIKMAVNDEGVLIISREYTPPTETIDIAFWWTDNSEPTQGDILNAMSQTQTDNLISHTDDFFKDDIQKRSLTAKRDESSFKYAFFAWHAGFFEPEPTKVDTGFGAPSTWVNTEVSVDGEIYKVMTVEITNNVTELEDYALVQEGIL
jgi:hypothetical protein